MKQRYPVTLALLFFILANAKVFAQQRSITGSVADLMGNAMPGVNVMVIGTSTGTVTDANGQYIIPVPDGSNRLIFSFVGFVSKEAEINNRTVVDVALMEDVKKLEEVVVTALNVERETKALQSSVTQISGDNFTQARENSMPNALAGRVAGVNVTKIASGPAGSSRIVIRGAKTLGGTAFTNYNQPLYVVDGIPIDNSNNGQAGVWGGVDWGDGMNSINPDDIQSITVLKGAASAALYGSRAATGVVLVTTKSGSNRKGLGIEYNGNFVVEEVINLTDWQQSYGSGGEVYGTELDDYVAKKPTDQKIAFENNYYDVAWGLKLSEKDSSIQFDGQWRPYANTGDNWSRFYQTGVSFTNSISLTGGTETQNFRASIAKLNSTGIIPNSGFDRLNLTLSVNSKFGDKLTLIGKMMYSNEKAKNRPMISDSPGSSVQAVYRIPADQNVYDYKGNPNKLGAVPEGMTTPDEKMPGEELQVSRNLWNQNPYWAAYQYVNSNKRDRVITSGQLRYDFTDFFYVQFKGGLDWSLERATELTPQGTGYYRSGFINEYETTRREINLEYIVGFDKEFGKVRVNTFLGGNQMRKNFELFKLKGNNGFNVPYHAAINNAVSKTFDYYYESAMINSLFASAEIGYNNYLFLTATARKDWFSTLQKENNSILYPSIGASFVFSEAFASMPKWLSFGKVRMAWAQVGDASSVRPFDTRLDYILGATHLTKPMAYFSSGANIPNSSLKPFRSEEVEFGIDVRFLENKIGFDVTYYSQVTTDDILKANVSNASGFFTSSVNLGKLTNKGVEAEVTATPVTGVITWSALINFALNNSKVVSLMPNQNELFVEEPRTRTVAIKHLVGHPYGMITGLIQQRDSGRLVFDEFGAPVPTTKHEVLGNGVPKFTGGVNNSISYKQFNLSFLVDFKWGGQIYSGTNSRMTMWGFHKQTQMGRAGDDALTIQGVQQIIDNNGTPNDGTDDRYIYEPVSRTLTPGEARNYWGTYSEFASDHFVYDASFVKLRQITLGYTFTKRRLNKLPFRTLTFSVVGRNVAILYKNVENIDPESSYTSSNAQGLDYFGVPASRTYGFNVNATF